MICFCLFNWLNTFAAENKSFQKDPFAALKGYKRVRLLKGKLGEMLGYIYLKENSKYKNGALTTLLVVKPNSNKLDTLYRVDAKGFFDSKGKCELKNDVKAYYGFKLYKESKNHTDSFAIGFVDRSGEMYSDDNDFFIDWNYKKKAFEYYPAP